MKFLMNAKAITTIILMITATGAAHAQTYDGVLTKRAACKARIGGDKNCSSLPKPAGKNCSVTLSGGVASFDIADLPEVQSIGPNGRTGQNHELVIYAANSSSKNLVFLNTGSRNSETPRSYEVKADYTISKTDYADYSYESYLCAGLKRRSGAPKTVSGSTPGKPAAPNAGHSDRASGAQ